MEYGSLWRTEGECGQIHRKERKDSKLLDSMISKDMGGAVYMYDVNEIRYMGPVEAHAESNNSGIVVGEQERRWE